MVYIPCLDGLRAVAIGLVLLSHLTKVPNVSNWLYEIHNLVYYGSVGVRIFFVLSGYLITHVLISEWNSTGRINLKNFFLRRALRIFPCFFFYLIVLLLLRFAGILNVNYDAVLLAFLYAQNWNVFQNTPTFATTWLVAHSWSLSVEEQFYLIYPFIFQRLQTLFSKHGLLTFGAIIAIGTFFRGLNYSAPSLSKVTGGPFFMHADFLLVGVGLRVWLPEQKTWLIDKLAPFKNLLLVLAIITMIIAPRFEYDSAMYILLTGTLVLFAITYLFFYIILFPQSRFGLILENPYLKYTGKLSYGLYVWQQLFFGSTQFWTKYSVVTYMPMALFLTFACALTSYHYIEKPFLRMKHRFSSSSYVVH